MRFMLLTASQAAPIEVEIMIDHFKAEQLTHHGFDLLDPWVTKLDHLATIQADQVIMLLEAV